MSQSTFSPNQQSTDDGGGNEDDGSDIIVIGTREKKDVAPENHLVLLWSGGGSGPPSYSDLGDWIARTYRQLFTGTSIDVRNGGFDQHHQDIIAQVIKSIASSKRFGDAWNHLEQQHLFIKLKQVYSPAQLGEAYGDHYGQQPDGTIPDGSRIDIRIAITRGGDVLASDKQFATTVLHELIHALGNPAWTARLDDQSQNWDEQLYRELFSSHVATDGQQIQTDIAHVTFSTEGGGNVVGDATHGILVGSISADTFSSGAAGNIILSGDGDDQIAITLGGRADEIQDDSGNDTLILPAGASLSNVHVAWSPDGKDLEISVDGTQEAIVIDASTTGAVEWIRIGSVDYGLTGLAATSNATPVGNETVFDVIGSYQGLIGSASANDPEGNVVHYRLAALDGAYVDQNWTVTDDGQIYANFLREDQPGSEFTFLTIIASDGVSASEFTETVHLGSAGDTGPVFRGAGANEQPPEIDAVFLVLNPTPALMTEILVVA